MLNFFTLKNKSPSIASTSRVSTPTLTEAATATISMINEPPTKTTDELTRRNTNNKRLRPNFSSENILNISTRVQIAPSIHLSHNESTTAPIYSTAERERVVTILSPALSRNADQFEQTQDYKNFVEKHGDAAVQEKLLTLFNKNGIVLNRILDEKFKVKVLHCIICKAILPKRKKDIERHLLTDKHIDNSQNSIKWQQETKTLRQLFWTWKSAQRGQDHKNSTVNLDVEYYRMETVREFMKAGVELSKIDKLRPYLERNSANGLTLSSAANLRYLIPFVHGEIKQKIISETKENLLCVIFDGTTRVDEVMAVIFRFVTDSFQIRQLLVRLARYEKCKTGQELANAVNEVLRMYGVDCGSNILPTRSGDVVAFQRDRASANTVAIEILSNSYRDSHDLHCLSHTITHCGDNCEDATVELKHFRQDLCALLNFGGSSNKASIYWMKIFDKAFQNPGNIRWWAVFELFIELGTRFDDLVTWVMTAKGDGDIDGVRIQRLHDCVINLQRRYILKLEMDIVAIVCKPLIKGTYILEGDGCTALIAFDLLESIRYWLTDHTPEMTFPGVEEAIDICSSNDDGRPDNKDIEEYNALSEDLRKSFDVLVL